MKKHVCSTLSVCSFGTKRPKKETDEKNKKNEEVNNAKQQVKCVLLKFEKVFNRFRTISFDKNKTKEIDIRFFINFITGV